MLKTIDTYRLGEPLRETLARRERELKHYEEGGYLQMTVILMEEVDDLRARVWREENFAEWNERN